MKVIITETGEKRYKFEDGDLIVRRKFEEALAGTNTEELAKIMQLLLEKAGQRNSEAWRNAQNYILEIDPDADLNGLSYDYFSGEFRNSMPK